MTAEEPGLRPVDRWAAAGLALITMILGGLRVGDRAFWLDEAFTAVSVDQSFGGLVRLLGREAGMGPYYLSLWFWAQAGDSEAWLRMLSVTGGSATVAAVYLFAARHAERRVAVIAAVALVCNPFFLRYFTELRAYSWAMCAAVISTMLFIRLRTSPSTGTAARYGASVGVMLALLAFAIGVVIAHLAFARRIVRDPASRRTLIAAPAVAVVVLAPFLPALLTSDQVKWIPALRASRVIRQTSWSFGGATWAAALALGNVILLVTFLSRARGRTDDIGLKIGLAVVVSAPMCLLALSFIQPLFEARYLAVALPFAVIGAAAGFMRATDALSTRARHRAIATALAVAVAVAGFPGSPLVDRPRTEDLREPAIHLRNSVAATDAVVFEQPYLPRSLEYYWPSPRQGVVVGLDGLDATEVITALEPFCRIWHVNRGGDREIETAFYDAVENAPSELRDFDGYEITTLGRCPD